MKTILVAEDHAVNRELVKEILQSAGYAVLEAADGEEVLLLLQENRPDLILIDLQMPKLDGVGTLRRIRANPEWRTLPVIACTAFAMENDQEQAMKDGFDGYLSKPITIAGLLAAVELMS